MTDLITLTNQDPGFYRLLGPFLASRPVSRQLGGRLWDDDGKRWWAVTEAGQVTGFAAAVAPEPGLVRLCSAYVVPSRRGQGLHTILVAARLGSFPEAEAEAVCTPSGLRACLSAGFAVTAVKGRYAAVRRPK